MTKPWMMKGATATQYREREGLAKLLASGLIKDRSIAIDGGAHVGSWTELLAQAFDLVHAYEPSPAFADLATNARDWRNVIIHNEALTDVTCRVETWHRKKIGKLTSRRVRKVTSGGVTGMPIDQLGLEYCGLIKLDVEGFEYPALIGARETIARTRPFVLVELAGHGGHAGYRDADVIALLHEWGYREVWKYNVDHGFAPERKRA